MTADHAKLAAITRRAGQWLLGEPLGRGGMAEVFAAQSPAGAPAAVKILHAGVASDPDLLARFWREVQIAGEIGHPGVVRVIDHGLADDGRPFLAMERLEGATLADLAKQSGGVGSDALLAYMDQLLEALAAAHDRSVIHRDLKPANLFITHEGRLKVLDFGIARLLEQSADDLRTATGIALGTVSYMAPEQAAGRRDEIDARTDIYAVGAILFRLLSGRRVHEGRNGGEMLLMTASRPAPPVASVAPQVPAAIAAVVDRALAFDRRERFPDARAMRAALAEARLTTGGPPARFAAQPEVSSEATALSPGIVSRTEPTVTATVTGREHSAKPALLAVGAVAIAVSLLVLAVLVVLILLQVSVLPDEPAWQEQVELGTLLDAYRRDSRAARDHYGSKIIRTTGPITEVQTGSNGYMRMGGASEPWLECYLRPIPVLERGSVVTVRGTVTAFQENPKRVVVSPCELVSAADASR